MNSHYATYPSLRNKVILITGGAEGIGAAAVELFYHQGSKVAFLDISEPSATALIEKLTTQQPPATSQLHPPTFHHCDVTDLARLLTVAEEILSHHGAVDVLINNAASAGGNARGPSLQVTPEAWDFDLNVNLRHHFFLTQAVVPSMQRQGSGSIINMGSITWRIPSVGLAPYIASKAAIMGLTRTHAKEFGAHGIRVNSIMPGSIVTERQKAEVLTPEYRAEVLAAQSLKRELMPEEVARLMLFLASEDSSGITGSSHVIDAGWVGDS